MLRPVRIAAALLLALVVQGCYTVPETGRQAFVLPGINDQQLGLQAFTEIKAKEKISTNAQDVARVERVGRRIAAAVGNRMPNAQWEFVTFEAPDTVNAFALPGGKVGVYTGLLRLASTDDELAFVLGHEIAHVTSRHGAQRMSEQVAVAAGALAVDQASRGRRDRELALIAYGVAATGGTLAFSRAHESEADYIGLRFAAYAGYDPRASVTFWQKMADLAKKQPRLPTFLSTHPSDASRIEALRRDIPAVMPIYQANLRP